MMTRMFGLEDENPKFERRRKTKLRRKFLNTDGWDGIFLGRWIWEFDYNRNTMEITEGKF